MADAVEALRDSLRRTRIDLRHYRMANILQAILNNPDLAKDPWRHMQNALDRYDMETEELVSAE